MVGRTRFHHHEIRLHARSVSILAATATVLLPIAIASAQGLPIPPRWVFEPWVWEDNDNTQASTLALVTDYKDRDIPVGAVIIDSPWETYYNSFEFCAGTRSDQYPNPAQLIDTLHDMDVRVIVWTTGVVNAPGTDSDGCNNDARPNFCNNETSQYFVNPDCNVRTHWWKNPRGVAGGKFVDFRSQAAASWWADDSVNRVLDLGVDGFKVDETDRLVGDVIANNTERRAYTNAYYRTLYRAMVNHAGVEAMITARPFDRSNLSSWGGEYGGISAPIDANPAGWVGDQTKTWGADGFLEALDNVLTSSELGYVACGSDIGGFTGTGSIPANLFVRWAQFGALCPIMENGGRGEHRPWRFSADVEKIFRRYAKLHHFLVAYLNHHGLEFPQTETPILRPINGWDSSDAGRRYTYTLGHDLFVAALWQDDDTRDIDFPPGDWLDFFDDSQDYSGSARLTFARRDYPLFIRNGAFLPLEVDQGDDDPGYELRVGSAAAAGRWTVLYYPDGQSSLTFHVDRGRDLALTGEDSDTFVSIDIASNWEERFLFRVKLEDEPGGGVSLDAVALPERASTEELDQSTAGWTHDATRGWLWVKFDTFPGTSELLVDKQPNAVSLDWFTADADAGDAADADAVRVILRWRTSWEQDHLGFHVVRADARSAGDSGGGDDSPGDDGAGNDGADDDDADHDDADHDGADTGRRINDALILPPASGSPYELVDDTVGPGRRYRYTLIAVDRSGREAVVDHRTVQTGVPLPEIPLLQSHPNPTGSRTTETRVAYVVARPETVRLTIHDTAGRLVRLLFAGDVDAGRHTALWDGRNDAGRELGAGVYFYRLAFGTTVETRKLVRVR